jgi:hypothetical protein
MTGESKFCTMEFPLIVIVGVSHSTEKMKIIGGKKPKTSPHPCGQKVSRPHC